jgi:hypothetical protein
MKRAVFFLAALVFFASCSRSEPRIDYGVLRLVYFEEPGGPLERFSFFIIPDDDDGIEDIDRLDLYYDQEGLVWSMTADDWVSFQADGHTWIGSRSIAMADDAALPRGQYRAVLTDKGGQWSQRFFSFDAPFARLPFPYCSLTDGIYRVESQYPDHAFICYDGEGTFLSSVALNALMGDLEDLGLPSGTRGVALWAEDAEYNTASLTDIIPVR